jgi:hypothetical protein
MSRFISSSPFQNTKQFLQIQSLAPGIARRSSERFQLRRAINPNPCIVCQIRGYRCVRLVECFVGACSVHRLDPRISGNRRISSRLHRGSSSPVRTSIVVHRVSSCSSFSHPCSASLPLPSPSPAAAPPPPPVAPPRSCPFLPPRRRRRGLAAALVLSRPMPARAAPWRRPPRPLRPVQRRPRPARPPQAQPLPSPPLSLPWMGGGRWREEEDEGNFVN